MARSIAVLLQKSQTIRSGGTDLVAYARELLEVCFADSPIYAAGGLVVPQLGEQSGSSLAFILREPQVNKCVELSDIKEVIGQLWRKCRLSLEFTSLQCTHRRSHFDCILSPVASGLEYPIGHFWAVAESSLSENAQANLIYASTIFAAVTRLEKASFALDCLSEAESLVTPITIDTVKGIAALCQRALPGTAVIIWLLDEKSRILKTTASTGVGGIHLQVDMREGEGVAGRCAVDGKSVIIGDLLDLNELRRYGVNGLGHPDIVRRFSWRSAIFVPLAVGVQLIGVLAVYGPRPYGFSTLDEKVALAFAQRLSGAYIYAKRAEELNEIQLRLDMEAPAIEAGMLAMERAHDADNQLTLAQDRISEITGRFKREPTHVIRKAADAASANIDKAHKTIKALVNRARISKLSLGRCELNKVLKEEIDRFQFEADSVGVRIHLKCPDELTIRADKEQLARVFSNFINNSIYWLESDRKGGQKQIIITVEPLSESVIVSIWDNGPGIAPNDIKKLFRYFYTTKGDRGMGFGLAIAKRIIEAHGGTVKVKSRWGYETEFTVNLPYDARGKK